MVSHLLCWSKNGQKTVLLLLMYLVHNMRVLIFSGYFLYYDIVSSLILNFVKEHADILVICW